MTPQEVLALHFYAGYQRDTGSISCGCGAKLPVADGTPAEARRALHPDHVVAELEAIGMVWQRERASA